MYSKILLPIDHTDKASWEKALPLALEEVKSHGAQLSVVTRHTRDPAASQFAGELRRGRRGACRR